ncbi:MAG: hypothetical protein HQK89_08830 [Nitrospirae bacterium]|nr:hypothetical protein [Nitrospirota bacterium]
MMRFLCAILVFLTGSLFATAAFCFDNKFDVRGLQPVQPNGIFSTFSTSTNETGVLSVETEGDYFVNPSFYRFSLASAFGLTDDLEISSTVPFRLQNKQDGFEDGSIGIRNRLFDEDGLLPSAGLLLSVSPPSGRDDLTTEGRYGGGLILSKKIGPFNAHTNVFFFVPFMQGLKTEIDVLLGSELKVANNISIIAELDTKKSHFSNSFDYMEGRLGYRYRPLDFLYTTLGAGYEIRRRNPDIRIFLTFTFIYPQKKVTLKHIYEEE